MGLELRNTAFFLAILWLAVSCSSAVTQSEWYDSGLQADSSKVDVLYLCSTEVLHSFDADSNELYQAQLSEDEKRMMTSEMDYAKEMFGDSFNFFSPYYHQYTFEAIALPSCDMAELVGNISSELCLLFDEYMARYNGGRRFILAGFSQGAQYIPYLLRHMTDEQYSRMVAAYMLGFSLTSADLSDSHTVAAGNATDTGVTISFNSVTTAADGWEFISSGSASCINPVNWTTDSTPAETRFGEDSFTVAVDSCSRLLTVSGLDSCKYRVPLMERYCSPGNLHHWDLIFYAGNIRENAVLRAYGRSN